MFLKLPASLNCLNMMLESDLYPSSILRESAIEPTGKESALKMIPELGILEDNSGSLFPKLSMVNE